MEFTKPNSCLGLSTQSILMSGLHQDLARKFIEQENQKHRIVLWSISNSPYCAATKKILQQFGAVVHELDQYDHGDVMQRELRRMTSQRTLPCVFVDDSHLGGYDSVRKAYHSGALHEAISDLESSSSSLDFGRSSQTVEDYFLPRSTSSFVSKRNRIKSLSVIQEAGKMSRYQYASQSLQGIKATVGC